MELLVGFLLLLAAVSLLRGWRIQEPGGALRLPLLVLGIGTLAFLASRVVPWIPTGSGLSGAIPVLQGGLLVLGYLLLIAATMVLCARSEVTPSRLDPSISVLDVLGTLGPVGFLYWHYLLRSGGGPSLLASGVSLPLLDQIIPVLGMVLLWSSGRMHRRSVARDPRSRDLIRILTLAILALVASDAIRLVGGRIASGPAWVPFVVPLAQLLFILLLAGAGWISVWATGSPDREERASPVPGLGVLPIAGTSALLFSLFLEHWSERDSPLFPLIVASVVASLVMLARLHRTSLLHARVLTTRQRDLEERVAARTADLEQARLQLLELSRTDPLTDLPNRRNYEERMGALWPIAMRRGWSVAVLMADLDQFKRLNDVLGHAEGDRCLVRVAQVLRDCFRREEDLCVRFGGEEFLVVLPFSSVDDAGIAGERLRRGVEEACIPHPTSKGGFVTISIGVAALVPPSGSLPGLLLQQADQALYRAKALGGNRVEGLRGSS